MAAFEFEGHVIPIRLAVGDLSVVFIDDHRRSAHVIYTGDITAGAGERFSRAIAVEGRDWKTGVAKRGRKLLIVNLRGLASDAMGALEATNLVRVVATLDYIRRGNINVFGPQQLQDLIGALSFPFARVDEFAWFLHLLRAAIWSGDARFIDAVLGAGINVNAYSSSSDFGGDIFRVTALHLTQWWAARHPQQVEAMLRYLLSHGADYRLEGSGSGTNISTPLKWAERLCSELPNVEGYQRFRDVLKRHIRTRTLKNAAKMKIMEVQGANLGRYVAGLQSVEAPLTNRLLAATLAAAGWLFERARSLVRSIFSSRPRTSEIPPDDEEERETAEEERTPAIPAQLATFLLDDREWDFNDGRGSD